MYTSIERLLLIADTIASWMRSYAYSVSGAKMNTMSTFGLEPSVVDDVPPWRLMHCTFFGAVSPRHLRLPGEERDGDRRGL